MTYSRRRHYLVMETAAVCSKFLSKLKSFTQNVQAKLWALSLQREAKVQPHYASREPFGQLLVVLILLNCNKFCLLLTFTSSVASSLDAEMQD